VNRFCRFVPLEVRAFRLFFNIAVLLVLGFGAISISTARNLNPNFHNDYMVFDFDYDGYDDRIDCDPSNFDIGPGIHEPDDYGDGVDNNCDGADGFDSDEDNYAVNVPALDQSIYPVARDCNGTNDRIYPERSDDPNDGIDSNCDGVD